MRLLADCFCKCFEIFLIFSSFNIGVITRCVCMYCVILFEASVYCVLATLVTEEVWIKLVDKVLILMCLFTFQAGKLTYSAYCSNWNNHYHVVPEKALVTTMSNCQLPVIFSAAGMMDVNLQTLVSVSIMFSTN